MSDRRDRGKTAADLMAELRGDPEFRAREEDAERRIAAAREEYRRAVAPMLPDLAAAGHPVETVGELVREFERTGRPYREAVPVMLRWLPRFEYRPLQDDIVRALAVPWAREATGPLIERFRSLRPHDGPPASDPRWVIGNALEALANPAAADDLLELAQDRRYGPARQMVVLGLARLRGDPRVVPALISLLDDEDVTGPAITALGRLRATEARERLRQFLQHPESHYRSEARKALKRIA